MGEIAGGAIHGTAAETVAAFVADDAVERAVDDSPVVLVGFGNYQPGDVDFIFALPLIEEALPLVLYDAIDKKSTFTAVGCSTVLITTTLVASHQRGTDLRSHTRYCRTRYCRADPRSAPTN
ncbi:hypothetical protein [Nocardia fluminea]|uniref:hypothetical protein n=1 Tax=Nocardia fluminea TaxID=134984 RepID=UPI003D0ACFB1